MKTKTISYQVIFTHPVWEYGTCRLDIWINEEDESILNDITKEQILEIFYDEDTNIEIEGMKADARLATHVKVLKTIKTKEVIKL